jgi:hypothetical protein
MQDCTDDDDLVEVATDNNDAGLLYPRPLTGPSLSPASKRYARAGSPRAVAKCSIVSGRSRYRLPMMICDERIRQCISGRR